MFMCISRKNIHYANDASCAAAFCRRRESKGYVPFIIFSKGVPNVSFFGHGTITHRTIGRISPFGGGPSPAAQAVFG
jgi:hypothetical protein